MSGHNLLQLFAEYLLIVDSLARALLLVFFIAKPVSLKWRTEVAAKYEKWFMWLVSLPGALVSWSAAALWNQFWQRL